MIPGPNQWRNAMRKLSIAIAVATGFAATPAMACSMMGQTANATPATAAASPMM